MNLAPTTSKLTKFNLCTKVLYVIKLKIKRLACKSVWVGKKKKTFFL